MNSHYLFAFKYARYSLEVSHVALVMNKEGELLIYKIKVDRQRRKLNR